MVVVIQDASGEWTKLTNWSDMEQACLVETRAQFSQSTQPQTPFTTQPLFDDFVYLAIRSKAEMVLAGMYKAAPGTDPHAKTLLQLLKMDDSIWMAEPVSMVLATEEYIQG